MNQKLLIIFVLAACLLVVSIPVFAHHGVAGYDMTKTITLHGTVTKLEWSNPHCVIFMDAKNANGEIANIFLDAGWQVTFARDVSPLTPPRADNARLRALGVTPQPVKDVVRRYLEGLKA